MASSNFMPVMRSQARLRRGHYLCGWYVQLLVGKAGNDGSANNVQCLAWGSIRGTKGFQLIT